ncbi:N-acetyltransferase family protein [Saccharopolyspora sp. NPDC050642]|uniref:GNAT family N-acetyltransferase n=1 Tax=Saccharopolyspora sp. NPDC050642 TaxID=3157099 RepID=UPI0033EB4C7C
MAAKLVVRDAEAGDAEAIGELFRGYVETTVTTFEEVPPTAQDWRVKIGAVARDGWPFLVATLEGDLVGYAYVSPWRPKPAYRHTVENTIYLHPGHVGRGIGRHLLGELLRRAAAAGAHQVIAVIADTGNPASEVLHRKAGFEAVGKLNEVGHKKGKWIDTTLMQLDLTTQNTR